LTNDFGWDVRVVIPSTQKSWIGKAYQIKDIIVGRYYYPRGPDGFGETSETSRPLKEGELAEWILLDGTPATCANIALHNLYPGEIDLLISGPNYGRNSSAAFALSSGTIGAAMSSSLSKIRSIALSYGNVISPIPKELFEPALVLSCKIIRELWDNWGEDKEGIRNGEVDLYNVNIPMIHDLLNKEMPVYWTTIWRNSYGRLFKAHTETKPSVSAAGPDGPGSKPAAEAVDGQNKVDPTENLTFKFAPDIHHLVNPVRDTLPQGSDGWAISHGFASVTPLRASFAEPPAGSIVPVGAGKEGFIKMKL